MATKTKVDDQKIADTTELAMEVLNQSSTMVDFDFSEFEGDLETSTDIPFLYVVSPPNVNDDQIKKLGNQYGFFIPTEQAEKAGFKPDSDWELTSLSFGQGSNASEVEGYLSKKVAFSVLATSPAEIEKKNEKGSWEYNSQAYNLDGTKTTLAESAADDENIRIVVRRLVMLLDDNNSPMADMPFSIKCRGGFKGTIGLDIKELWAQVNKAYIEKSGSKGKKLPNSVRPLVRVSGTLGYIKSDGKAPFTCFKTLEFPVVVIENVGKSRTIKRDNYQLEVTGVPLGTTLISPSSETGEILKQAANDYKAFSEPRKANVEKPVVLTGYWKAESTRWTESQITCQFAANDGNLYTVILKEEDCETLDELSEVKIKGMAKAKLVRGISYEVVQALEPSSNDSESDEEIDFDEIPF